jgi:hypothetical protein
MRTIKHSSTICAWALIWNGAAFAYEIPNHADMSQTSAEKSVLEANGGEKLARLGLRKLRLIDNTQSFPVASGLPQIPLCFGVSRDTSGAMVANPNTQPPWNTDAGRTVLSIANLIRYGACYEDNEGALLLTNQRPIAHFYDPQRSGAAIRSGEPSSPDWMLLGATGTVAGSNHFGWADARGAFYRALTYRDPSAGVSATENDLARKGGWADTFQSIGHLIHHLQDMAQPQHVRSDDHCDAAQCAAVPGLTYKPSGYEKHLLNNRLEFVQTLAASASAPIMFGLPREFWNAVTPANQPLTGAANLTGQRNSQEGIAAYAATNFVSTGTNFRREFNGAVYVTAPDPAHPFPQPASQTNDVSLTTLYANAPQSTLDTIKNTLCNGNATTCYMKFLGTNGDPLARTAATSIFSPELLNPSNTYVGDRLLGPYTQNYWTYDDAATKLVPRAVEYSAGLINYFFRGEMEVSLPDEGVYAILDHAVTNAKGSGFNFIKLKVKNTTADITTAPTATRPTGLSKQDMTAGQFFAVAKFHRNTCYTPDLRGQIGTVGRGASAVVNPWSCRSPVEEIVVSAAEPSITSLAAGDPAVTMAFDFPNPIPIEATDLFIQIVFKGKLGEEQDAVAVTTKNLSEPSFLTHLDASDVIACGTEEGNICRPIDDTSATVYFKACASNATLCDVTVPQRSKFGFNRWLGFKPETPSTKVIEWHAARTDLPDAPTYQVDRGTYRRVALLADVETPNRTISWGSSTQTVTIAVDKGDLPLSFGLFNSTGQFFPTAEALIPAVSRLAATQLKETVGGTAPSVLPQYSVIRGVVMGVNKLRPSAPDALPGLIYSSGENVKTASYYDAVKHPDNSTVFEQGPVLPTDALKAVGSLKFSRSTPFGLPALTTLELAQLAGDADGYRLNRQPRLVRTQDATAYYAWTEQ